MKSIFATLALVLTFSSFAMADFETWREEHCHYPEPRTQWTCFARDARGQNLGISTSFTERRLAAGRALANCQKKSPIPDTCHITLCKQPQPECH